MARRWQQWPAGRSPAQRVVFVVSSASQGTIASLSRIMELLLPLSLLYFARMVSPGQMKQQQHLTPSNKLCPLRRYCIFLILIDSSQWIVMLRARVLGQSYTRGQAPWPTSADLLPPVI